MKTIMFAMMLLVMPFGATVEAVDHMDRVIKREDRRYERQERRLDRRERRQERRQGCARHFDFASSFGSQRVLTESIQQQLAGSMRDLTEASRLAGMDRERLMDRLAENKQDRARFEQELNGFRAERSGLLEQLRSNRAERQIANAKARAERENQMIELAKAEKERNGLMDRLGISQRNNERLFAKARSERAPLKNMMKRLTTFVVWIMIFLVTCAACFLLGSFLWNKAKSKVGM